MDFITLALIKAFVIKYINENVTAGGGVDYSVTMNNGIEQSDGSIEYTLSQLGVEIGKVTIPKDIHPVSGEMVTQEEKDYIKLIMSDDEELLIDVSSLMEDFYKKNDINRLLEESKDFGYYEGGNGIAKGSVNGDFIIIEANGEGNVSCEEKEVVNLIDGVIFFNGVYFSSNSSDPTSGSSDVNKTALSDFIKVNPNVKYITNIFTSKDGVTPSYINQTAIAFYNNNQQFISKINNAYNQTEFITPDNCFYIRVCTFVVANHGWIYNENATGTWQSSASHLSEAYFKVAKEDSLVNISSATKYPLYGLPTFDGGTSINTNISQIKAVYPKTKAASFVLKNLIQESDLTGIQSLITELGENISALSDSINETKNNIPKIKTYQGNNGIIDGTAEGEFIITMASGFSSDITVTTSPVENLIKNINQGGSLDSNGNIIMGYDDYYTDFIPVKPNTQYITNLFQNSMGFVVVFDINKNIITYGRCYKTNITAITTYNNAYYYRFSVAHIPSDIYFTEAVETQPIIISPDTPMPVYGLKTYSGSTKVTISDSNASIAGLYSNDYGLAQILTALASGLTIDVLTDLLEPYATDEDLATLEEALGITIDGKIDEAKEEIEGELEREVIKEYSGLSTVLEDTVDGECYVTDFPVNLVNITEKSKTSDDPYYRGMEFIVDKEAGTITLFGSVENTEYFKICDLILEEGETYTLTGNPLITDKITLYCLPTSGSEILLDNGEGATGIATAANFMLYLRIYPGLDISSEGVVIKPCLVRGTSKRGFIPYNGCTVKTTGKNIFGGEALANKIVEFGGTKNVVDKTVSYTMQNIKNKILFDCFKENQVYTFFIKVAPNTIGKYINLMIKYDDGTQTCTPKEEEDDVIIFSSDNGKTVKSFIGYFGDTDSNTLLYDECGIFEGVLTAEDFEPYQESVVKLTPNTPLPITGLRTFNSVTNLFTDFDITLTYLPNRKTSSIVDSLTNQIDSVDKTLFRLEQDFADLEEDFNENRIGEYRGQTGTIENTVNAPAYVTDFPVNLLEITAESQTVNGITFTVDKKTGTITANGTAASDTILRLAPNMNTSDLPDIMFLSCCPKGGSQESYYCYSANFMNDTWVFESNDTGDGAVILNDNRFNNMRFFILIKSGVSCNNLVFRPCLVKGDKSCGFIPYRGGIIKTAGQNGEESEIFLSPNTTLPADGLKTFDRVTSIISDFDVSLAYFKTENSSIPAKVLEGEIEKYKIGEYKGKSGTISNTVDAPCYVTDFPVNLLEITAGSQTVNGVTFTVDKEAGTITVNGTAAQDTYLILYRNDHSTTETLLTSADKDIFLSGCPSGGNIDSYMLELTLGKNSAWHSEHNDTGNGVSVNISDAGADVIRFIQIIIKSGTVCNNLVFRPCLVKGSSPRGFIPYGGGMVKLTDGSGNESEIFLSPDTPLPAAGLETFDGVTNIISDFDVSLAYHKDEPLSIPVKALINEFAEQAEHNTETDARISAAELDIQNLARAQFIFPNNKLINDNKGLPSVMVRIPKMSYKQLGIGDSDDTFPAWIINGREVDVITVGKYQAVVNNNRAYSLPGQDPATYVSHDHAVTYSTNKGEGWHAMTRLEWMALALYSKVNGTQPKGNNNFGKDTTETLYKAIPSCPKDGNGKTQRVATGTGPLSWSHNGEPDGVWDMNGNIFEWNTGVRTVYGELQVISNDGHTFGNDAADPENSLSPTSALWRAIDGTTGELITPNGAGTTPNSLKIDKIANVPTWVTGALVGQSMTYFSSTFEAVACADTVCDAAKHILQALGFYKADNTAGAYNGDTIYFKNGEAERAFFAGGHWGYGTEAGVFHVRGNNPRSSADMSIGFRPAYAEL